MQLSLILFTVEDCGCLPKNPHSFSISIHTDTLELSKKETTVEHVLAFLFFSEEEAIKSGRMPGNDNHQSFWGCFITLQLYCWLQFAIPEILLYLFLLSYRIGQEALLLKNKRKNKTKNKTPQNKMKQKITPTRKEKNRNFLRRRETVASFSQCNVNTIQDKFQAFTILRLFQLPAV